MLKGLIMSIYLSSELESIMKINKEFKPSLLCKKQTWLIKFKAKISNAWNTIEEDESSLSEEGVWCINVGYVWPDKDS